MKTPSKRARRICANCKCTKYLIAREVDSDIGLSFLCSRCDDAYITWENAGEPGHFWVSDFLMSNAARRCK